MGLAVGAGYDFVGMVGSCDGVEKLMLDELVPGKLWIGTLVEDNASREDRE